MARKASILLRAFLGAAAGLVLGILLMCFESLCPRLLDALGAPAIWVFERWHQLGLPPQGEAALAGPFAAFFIQWILLGAVIGALSGCRRRAGTSARQDGKGDSADTRGEEAQTGPK
ncbi:MAG: hypothetical protein ACLQLG_05255 [Thermoguttaceae bacterium]